MITLLKYVIPRRFFGYNIDHCGTFLDSSFDFFFKKVKNIKTQIYFGELEIPVTYFFSQIWSYFSNGAPSSNFVIFQKSLVVSLFPC